MVPVLNVRLHGDSENDHKNANGLRSEAFQKRIENGLRVHAKNGKNCKRSCDNHEFAYLALRAGLENEGSSRCVSFFASQFDSGLSVE